MERLSVETPKTPLCEICSNINFEEIAVAAKACTDTTHGISAVAEIDFGTIEDILQRQERCVFCEFLARHSLEQPGRYKLTPRLNFCASSDQQEYTHDYPHTHTTLAQIQLFPEEVLTWAPAPWEVESHETHAQSIRHVLDIQAGQSSRHDEHTLNPWGIKARRIRSSIDTNLPKEWLSICERHHIGRCPHSAVTPTWDPNFMPAFVIDVEHSCIAQPPANCRYIALSYVWGTGKMLRHIKANSATLKSPRSLQELDMPTTIRDAMTLVQQIGERYLWVDALCIIQDDPEMQQSQIAKMDQVYAKALFTIVAAYGASADAGLPGVGPSARKQVQDVVHVSGQDFHNLICDNTEFGNILKKVIWSQRAWTMQELLCSGRCLIFTQTQMYWRCQAATFLEELALEKAKSNDLEILHYAAQFKFPDHELNRHEYFRLYENLLKSYIQRRLSFQSDRLNGFSGICARLSAIQSDIFIWGHPQSQFSRSLGWQIMPGHYFKHTARTNIIGADGRMQEVSFPSWSWTAWLSEESIAYFNFLDSGTWSPSFGWSQRVQGSRKWHPDGNEFHPVADFWYADHRGMIVPIVEPGTHGAWSDTYDTEHRLPWQRTERQLPDSLCGLDVTARLRRPGLLYFWTSVVTVKLRDGSQQGSMSHLMPPSFSQSKKLQEINEKAQNDGSDDYTLDFAVVCRTDELGRTSPRSLLVLTIEWEDGIAHCLGSQLVKETDWVALEGKRWELVILG